jgi:hypothetical protein
MIISEEQARLAAQYLQGSNPMGAHRHAEVSPELMARVVAAVDRCPECRAERVEQAITDMGAGSPGSREVAEKMISRIISDSLR